MRVMIARHFINQAAEHEATAATAQWPIVAPASVFNGTSRKGDDRRPPGFDQGARRHDTI